jgi:hypothetical protein
VTLPARIAVALAALLALAIAPGADARRSVPRPFMGVNWDDTIAHKAPESLQAQQFPRMAAAGAEGVRVAFSWARAQPQPGDDSIDLSASDRFVALASARRVRVLPDVILAPDWARLLQRYPQSPPRDPRDFRPYVRAIVLRYGPHGTFWNEHPELPRLPIRQWQFWNEPHLPFQWTLPHGYDWRKTYTDQLHVFHDAVKAADPKAKVVLGGLTNESWKYLNQLYKAGAGRWFDIAAVHPYTRKPEGVLEIVRRFRTVMKRHHQNRKPVWITEFGLPASRGHEKTKNHLQTNDKGMASFLSQAYALLARNRHRSLVRVSRAYWYTWASKYKGDIFTYSGLFKYRPKHRLVEKPAYRAFVRIARRLEGCTKGRSGRCR